MKIPTKTDVLKFKRKRRKMKETPNLQIRTPLGRSHYGHLLFVSLRTRALQT